MRHRCFTFALCWCVLVSGFGVCATFAAEPKPAPDAKPAPAAADKTDAKKDEKAKEDEPKDRWFAVTGAVVHTVSGPTLHAPTVLCKNGKIAAIGHDVAVPEEAETLDATGFHLYPGLVAVGSNGLVGNEPPEDNTNVYGLSLTLGLAGGVTTVVAGNTAAKLTYGALEDHVVRRNLFHSLSYNRRDPNGRRNFRLALERARQYLRDLQAHEEKKKTDPKAKPPAELQGEDQAALKLLRHELVSVADANTAQELRDLASLVGQYRIRLVVRGAREGWTVAGEMARAGLQAVITPRTRRDRDERTNRPNGSSIENARILHEHGVPLAIIPLSTGTSTMGLAGRDLLHLPMEAAFAIRGGLPDEAALRAITLGAARILGIDHRVGSIEVGKDADFAIVDGDLLHYMTLTRWTVVNGRIAYDKQKDSLFNHIRPGGDLDAPPPRDDWPRRLGEGW